MTRRNATPPMTLFPRIKRRVINGSAETPNATGTAKERTKITNETRKENSSAWARIRTFFWVIAAAAERSADIVARMIQSMGRAPLSAGYEPQMNTDGGKDDEHR